MGVSVRQADESDWQALRSLRLKALRSDPSVFGSNHQRESAFTEADWKNWLRTDDTAIFLIFEDADLIGMTGIAVDRDDPTRRRAVLWGSWLEPSARGKGLSQLMYRRRIQWAERHPTIERIIVSHRASNLPSMHAIRRHGFRFSHSEDRIWPDGTREANLSYVLNAKPNANP